MLYLYVLQRMQASKVALVPLITPVFALLLGASLAGEAIAASTMVGAAMILAGLAAHQYADRRPRLPRRQWRKGRRGDGQAPPASLADC